MAVGFAIVWSVTVEPRMMIPSGMMTMNTDTQLVIVDGCFIVAGGTRASHPMRRRYWSCKRGFQNEKMQLNVN